MSIAMLLEMAAEGMPERIAVGPPAAGLTYAQLLDRSRRVATVVAESGAERLGLVAENSEWLPTLLFAGSFAGTPFVPLNYRLADDRLRAVCSRIAPAITAADAGVRGRLDQLQDIPRRDPHAAGAGGGGAPPSGETPPIRTRWHCGCSPAAPRASPKAAMLRHRHLVAYVLSTVEYMSAEEDEATLVEVPPYHIASMAGILSSIYAGRRIVYVPQFDPEEWVRRGPEEAVTHAMVVPTMLARILDVLETGGARLPALRHLSYGGGRMPVPVIERAMRLLPQVGYVNAYGLTETSSTVAVLGPDDHRAALASDDPAGAPPTGFGRAPVSGPRAGNPRTRGGGARPGPPRRDLRPRRPDRRRVRGPQRTAGLTAGFPPTTGAGSTHDGFLFVEGRLDDVIVRGGENISPGEIEDVLALHPAVVEAAVVGIADDEWGEVPAAAAGARAGNVGGRGRAPGVGSGPIALVPYPGGWFRSVTRCPTTRWASCCAGSSKPSSGPRGPNLGLT